jgi:hypothetical protein
MHNSHGSYIPDTPAIARFQHVDMTVTTDTQNAVVCARLVQPHDAVQTPKTMQVRRAKIVAEDVRCVCLHIFLQNRVGEHATYREAKMYRNSWREPIDLLLSCPAISCKKAMHEYVHAYIHASR